ncbi:MAG TPA: CDP-diacylglycerol--glycerol-3-phosphate 3-phosphatidyltransferase [Syntrophomonadaceae bacterium]|nr:CDP-diacylglycerol--glycerol-3-phosphate 3-phosphatidyltransferase [Syntrophomonadaceae bacterium]
MNLPNTLTIMRIILIPIFMFVFLTGIPYGDFIATGVFILAAITDSLDGYLARKWNQITKLGIILDPLADKMLITAALISLVQLGRLPGWIAVIIIVREFAVTGLRSVKAEEGIIIPASNSGKIKTVTQIIAIILLISESIYKPYLDIQIGMWVMYLAVFITIVSGLEYFYKYKSTE